MTKVMRNILFFMLAVGALGLLHIAYTELRHAEVAKSENLAALLEVAPEPFVLQEATQFADCQAIGPLPDPECTPGDVFDHVTTKEICVSGYSATVRDVSTKLKQEVFARYNIAYPVPFGSYEVDHLIPLSLGGSNNMSNLWPKAAEPFPGFYEKNITGYYLLEEVCEGRVTLSVAQGQIAKNWYAVYQNLDPDTIAAYKKRYPNWASRGVK